MESVVSANDQRSMVGSFLEIAVGQTSETARQFLQATNWNLEEAIQLFYIGNEGGHVSPASQPPQLENASAFPDVHSVASNIENQDRNTHTGQDAGEEVRAPLPVVRDTLYEDAAMAFRASRMGLPPHEPSSLVAFRNFDEEMKRPAVWETDQGTTSTADNPNLASLYRPPFHLMFHGSFEKAKGAASVQDKWLLVNIQSNKEFSSHMLNRDTWANEAVSQTVSTNFIFWQVYDDVSEGRKVCTYYRLESIPVVLVIDPITGQKMRAWSGMVHPERLLENLVPFLDGGPRDHHVTLSHKRPRGSSQAPPKHEVATNEEDEDVQRALAVSMEGMKDSNKAGSDGAGPSNPDKEEEKRSTEKPTYPILPAEPQGDKSLMCRVGLRFPDGHRIQRNFLKTDPIQLLWSFCYSEMEKTGARPFRLTQAIPGATSLDYESKLTFGESGLANSMISVAWE